MNQRTHYHHFWATNRPLNDREWFPLVNDVARILRTCDDWSIYLIKQTSKYKRIRIDSLSPRDYSLFELSPEPVSFAYVRTNWEMYDVCVTAAMLVAKRRLPDWIKLTSDGLWKDWQPARDICSEVLGYKEKDFSAARQDFMELLPAEERT